MVVFRQNVENQFLAYSEEAGGKLTLHEEGEELKCFPKDTTKNKHCFGDPETKVANLNCLDP